MNRSAALRVVAVALAALITVINAFVIVALAANEQVDAAAPQVAIARIGPV